MKKASISLAWIVSAGLASTFALREAVRWEMSKPPAPNRLAVEQVSLKRTGEANRAILPASSGVERLPAYYRSSAKVSDEQREQIYELQRKYIPLLNYLKKRVELLKTELDEKIESVLTEEQRKKVEQGRKSGKTRPTARSPPE